MAMGLELAADQLEEVRFGRNRLLALMGGALTATALKWFGQPDEADAQYQPYMCNGAPMCSCCNPAGARCCDPLCGTSLGCTGVTQCWFACNEVTHDLWLCCDHSYRFIGGPTWCMCQSKLVTDGCLEKD